MITDSQLERYSKKYGVPATRCNKGKAVNLMGQAFDPCLLELGLTDSKSFEFVKLTLIEKNCPQTLVDFVHNLKEHSK